MPPRSGAEPVQTARTLRSELCLCPQVLIHDVTAVTPSGLAMSCSKAPGWRLADVRQVAGADGGGCAAGRRCAARR